MTRLIAVILLLVLTTSISKAATPIKWPDLKDPDAASFEDPFEALSIPELRALGNVFQLRQRLERGNAGVEEQRQMTRKLAREEAKLAASGVQTDWLLDQRETIGRKRAEAALSGNSALQDTDISITGYVIPILDRDGTSRSGYLVPEYGMCSHMPAPDPNQMIRYHLKSDWKNAELYLPVLLSGRLDLKLHRQTINLLDGQVEMVAAFELDVQELRPLNQSKSTADQRDFRSFGHNPGDSDLGPGN